MSIIYKIYCKDENIKDCYVGSTNDLNRRKRQHKYNCNNNNSNEYNFKLYKFMRDNSGFENFDFIILEQFENKMIKQDLLKIEGQYIKNNNATLNCIIAGRTDQEYYQDNRTKILEYKKKYQQENKTKLNEINQKYREDNKEKISEYRKNNKEKQNEYNKQYYGKNKEQINEKKKEKVICEFCKILISNTNLKRHQQTKKCIECKNNIL
jgi:hypothetical protein